MFVKLWGFDGTDWQPVATDTDGNLKVNVKDVTDNLIGLKGWDGSNYRTIRSDSGGILLVAMSGTQSISARNYGYSGSDWYKLGYIFNYYDVYDFRTYKNATANPDQLSTTNVSEGYIHVVTNICLHNESGACTGGFIIDKGSNRIVRRTASLAQYETGNYSNPIYLKSGESLTIGYIGIAVGNTIVLEVHGYKMRLNM